MKREPERSKKRGSPVLTFQEDMDSRNMDMQTGLIEHVERKNTVNVES